MRKSFQITNVRVILNIDKPIVIFEVAGGDAIVRNPKQALTDLQNSGRALDIDAKEFVSGIENVSLETKAKFQTAVLDTIGAVLSGEITTYKAGDEYTITGSHPALKDVNHPLFGQVKEGDKQKAEKDGVWIEGFLSIPLTEQEKMRRDVSGNISKALMALYGFGNAVAIPTAVVPETPFEEPKPSLPTQTQAEAFGEGQPVQKK